MALFTKDEPKKEGDDPKPDPKPDPQPEHEVKAACIIFNIYCGDRCKKEK